MEPYLGQQLLFWTRSQNHLTPFSQELAGKALAELILRNGLLERPQPAPGPAPRPADAPERSAAARD
jgi:hypothetical protein